VGDDPVQTPLAEKAFLGAIVARRGLPKIALSKFNINFLPMGRWTELKKATWKDRPNPKRLQQKRTD